MPRQTLAILAFCVLYAVATAFAENSYHQLILTVVPVWAVMGLAWNLLSGYSGFVSFGHAAFFGLGAYFVALAQLLWGWSPWFTVPGAAVVGGAAGLIVGLPTFRLRGHYFALAMLASVFTRDKAKGIGLALLLWFYFTLLYDALVLFIMFSFADYPLEKATLVMAARLRTKRPIASCHSERPLIGFTVGSALSLVGDSARVSAIMADSLIADLRVDPHQQPPRRAHTRRPAGRAVRPASGAGGAAENFTPATGRTPFRCTADSVAKLRPSRSSARRAIVPPQGTAVSCKPCHSSFCRDRHCDARLWL